jgi:hypothetical protein
MVRTRREFYSMFAFFNNVPEHGQKVVKDVLA